MYVRHNQSEEYIQKIQIRTFIPENVAQLVRSLRYVAREVYVAATLHV